MTSAQPCESAFTAELPVACAAVEYRLEAETECDPAGEAEGIVGEA